MDPNEMRLAEVFRRLAARLEAEGSARACYTSAVVVGVLVALRVFGLTYLTATSPFWEYPGGDVKFNIVGLSHFVAEPWTFPPGISRQMSPDGISISFTDSIPLLAFPAKLLAPIAPAFLQPVLRNFYGPWMLIAWVLQAVMAVRFLRAVGVRSLTASVSVSVLVCSLPFFIFRRGHAALEGQFLITWSLLLVVLARHEVARWRRGAEWALLLSISAMTHIYLLVMCAGLFGAWLLVLAVHHRAFRVALPSALAGGGTIVATLYLLGMLGARATKSRAWGFGVTSWNPLSLFVPRQSTLFGARFADRADATGFQYEGFAYLGAGALLLVGFVVVTRRRDLLDALRRHALLAVVLFACLFFAASNRVYVGRMLVLSYEVPAKLEYLTSQLRSSGRFVWPAIYALLLFAVVRAARVRRFGGIALAIAAFVQLLDSTAQAALERGQMNDSAPRVLDWAKWQPMVEEHDAVWSTPTFDCLGHLQMPQDVPELDGLNELSFLAAKAAKPVNTAFTPRAIADCNDEIAAREKVVPKSGTLYVVARRVATASMIANFIRQGAPCISFSLGFACSRRFADPLLAPTLVPGVASAADAAVHIADASNVRSVGQGWAPANGAKELSTEQARATLFVLGGPKPRWLEVVGRGYVSATRPRQEVDVELDGTRIGTLSYSLDEDGDRSSSQLLPLPSGLPTSPNGLIVIDFVPRDIRSPRELGVDATDDRRLGAAIVSVRVGDRASNPR
jgi:hypothetical protein